MFNERLKLFSVCLSITFVAIVLGSGLRIPAILVQSRPQLLTECVLASVIGTALYPRLIRWLDAMLPPALSDAMPVEFEFDSVPEAAEVTQ